MIYPYPHSYQSLATSMGETRDTFLFKNFRFYAGYHSELV